MEELEYAVEEFLAILRSEKRLAEPTLERPSFASGPECYSTLDQVPKELQTRILQLASSLPTADLFSPALDRSIGALVGLAIADGMGHNFEFLPACDQPGGGPGQDGPWVEHIVEKREQKDVDDLKLKWHGIKMHENKLANVFQLKPGQWTDDASMALCLADSLLIRNDYDGAYCRILYYNWWNNGWNNAFKFDDTRSKKSVGLGGNISESLKDLEQYRKQQYQQHDDHANTDHEHENDGLLLLQTIPPRYIPKDPTRQHDAGNGSLMRLAPLSILYAAQPQAAKTVAYESSLSTHPGPLAAEACSFLSSLVGACIHRPENKGTIMTAKEFLFQFVQEYQGKHLTMTRGKQDFAKQELSRLLSSSEAEDSTERCWNWKNNDYPDEEKTSDEQKTDTVSTCCSCWKTSASSLQLQVGLGVEQTLRNRGHTYNGHPVNHRYFGSFSLDALAMAMFCVQTTTCFMDAILRCINFCGDADTTGAITAQIAGAFYGRKNAIPRSLVDHLETWDGGGGFELRAICLAVRGCQKVGNEEPVSPNISNHTPDHPL